MCRVLSAHDYRYCGTVGAIKNRQIPCDAQRMAYRAEPTIGAVKQAGVWFTANLRGVDEDFDVVVGVVEKFF
jgi:hypothetical protein